MAHFGLGYDLGVLYDRDPNNNIQTSEHVHFTADAITIRFQGPGVGVVGLQRGHARALRDALNEWLGDD